MELELAFGLQSDLFHGKLTEKEVQAAQEAGFSFFEMWGMEPHFPLEHADEAERVRRMLDKFGMRVKSLHAPIDKGCDISAADESVRQESVGRMKLAAERLVVLGGDVLVVHPGRGRERDEEVSGRMRQSERSVTELCDSARELGITIALENLCPNEVFDNPDELRSMIDHFDRDLVGICLDSSHANIRRDAVETTKIFQGRVFSVHLSDNNGTGDDHSPPFEGTIDWEGVLGVLIDGGFRGPWLFEVLGWGADPYDFLRRAAHGRKRMRDIIIRLMHTGKSGP
jgi:sugar phosphate isomerase/epimerase